MKTFVWLLLPLLLVSSLTLVVAQMGGDDDARRAAEEEDRRAEEEKRRVIEERRAEDEKRRLLEEEARKKAAEDEAKKAEAPATVEIDKTAPSFKLKNANGKEVNLDDYKGKYIILEWVNYDCPFVKKFYANSGHMPKLQEKYRKDEVVWLSICSSSEGKQGHFTGDALLERIKKEKANADFYLIDEDGAIGRKYKATTTPYMIVIDKDLKVRYRGAIDSIKSAKAADIEKATNYVDAAMEAIKAGKDVEKKEVQSYG